MKDLKIFCPSFGDGGSFAEINTLKGGNVSPEIKIFNLEENAVSLAIVLDKATTAIALGTNRWVMWNIEPTDIIPQGIPEGERVLKGAVQGLSCGIHGYNGAKTAISMAEKYKLTVYALDKMPNLAPKCGKSELMTAIKGHILQTASLNLVCRKKETAEKAADESGASEKNNKENSKWKFVLEKLKIKKSKK